MAFVFSKAIRRRVPLLVSADGVSGSGKTYSMLKLSAGMVGPKGRVALLDTENRRGEMYADEPGIMRDYPDGYEYAEMKPPYSPARYIEAIDDAEKAGITCLIIDSGSHEWEGFGGCSEIAEKAATRAGANWSKGKLEHKKFMNRLLSSSMDIVTCLRAREKVKVVKDARGETQYVPQGIMPICEKNFVFEMTLSVMIDEGTHKPNVRKVPAPLAHLFPPDLPLITKDIGAHMLAWAESGSRVAKTELTVEDLKAQAFFAASEGTTAFRSFCSTLTKAQWATLKPFTDDFKARATAADEADGTVFGELAARIRQADSAETLSAIHAEMLQAHAAGDIDDNARDQLDALAQQKMEAVPA